MTELCPLMFRLKSRIWPIHINFDIQTKFEVNQTQIPPKLAIISPNNSETTKMAQFFPGVIHQKAYSSYIF